MKNTNTKTLTRVALLVAIELVMKLVGLGSVPVGPLYMSFLTLPIAVGAITMGPAVGALLGGVFGAVSFYDAITGASAMTGALFQVSPLNTFILCVGMRVLMGLCCGLIFKGLQKLDKSRTWSYILSAMTAPAPVIHVVDDDPAFLRSTLFMVEGLGFAPVGYTQAQDFLDESEALATLVSGLSDADFEQQTQFKHWTINNIIRHLHVWNIAVGLSLESPDAFEDFLREMASGIRGGRLPDFEARYLDGLSGVALQEQWIEKARAVAASFGQADPKLRLKWVGPDMSAISSITARLMETWAHAQAVYDVLGVERVDSDRIGNIVRLGVNTYGWTFKNRGEDVPGPMPRLRLTAPSSAIWDYGEGEDLIEGSASEFCQVVTQCRNIADTGLSVSGPVATNWMAVAQCFAGPAQDPPPKGARHRA